MSKQYICVRCKRTIEETKAERIDLVIYCPRCAKEFRDDAEIQALLDNTGASC